jgi:hypothetical protein
MGVGVGGTGVKVGGTAVGVDVFSILAASWGGLSSTGGGLLSSWPPQAVIVQNKNTDNNKNTNLFEFPRSIFITP